MARRNFWQSFLKSIPANLNLFRRGVSSVRKRQGRFATEVLEDRTLLTAYVVDTLDDTIANDSFTSLREAIEAASTNTASGNAPAGTVAQDTITFANGLTGTITLGLGDLSIGGDLQITGPGWENLVIDANNNSRVFFINSGANAVIDGVTITGGNGSGGYGGGIENQGATLLLSNSYVHGNSASDDGGGIDTFDGGTTTILNSTIADNSAAGGGGGLNVEDATLHVINSTVSGNSAEISGGGIQETSAGTVTITNSTITGNRSNSAGGVSTPGGGIFMISTASGTIHNSIVAGNFDGTGTTPHDVGGTFNTASSFNVIGDAATAGGLTDGVNNNIVGNSGTGTRTTSSILNTTLQNIDGTMLHLISFSGPAWNNGSNALSVDQTSTRLQFDQRGGPFGRVMDGTVDIGAHEITVLKVNTLQDETTDPDTLSLREAIAVANFNPAFDNIFSLPTGTINLTQGQLVIDSNLKISGPGADQLTIDAQGNSRIFEVNGGIDVEIVGMTLTGGSSIEGGAIRNTGNLTLRGMHLTGNSTTLNSGGAISNISGGLLTVLNSTLSGNSALSSGGGVRNDGMATIVNSTISGNSAGTSGGGVTIFTGGTIVLINSTITGNRAESDGGSTFAGGGVRVSSGAITLYNTIVAGNFVGTGTTPNDIDVNSTGATFSASHSLIGDAATSGGLTDGTNGNIVGVGGTGVRDINTILNTTLNGGGPTPTHSLLAGSPTINAGDNTRATDDGTPGGTALATDQRGLTRIVGGTVDIGAVEADVPVTLVVSTLDDENDGDFSDGDLSLREAIEIANGRAGFETITFNGGLSGQIALTLGQLEITDHVEVSGPGVNTLGVAGDGTSNVFRVSNNDASFIDVIIGRIYIIGGGRGVRNEENLTLENVVIFGNHTTATGGGINHDFGELVIRSSEISGNSATQGGGMELNSGTVFIINSTISENSSTGNGAGILARGTATVNIVNTTISQNIVDSDQNGGDGGGLAVFDSSATTMHNSIVAGNREGSGAANDVANATSLQSGSANNIVGHALTNGGLMHGVNGNIVGNSGSGTIDINTILNPISDDNGGTGIFSHALVANSIAIDAGNTVKAVEPNGNPLTLDQHDGRRVFDGDGDGDLRVDIGSVEAPPKAVNGGIVYDQSNGSFRMATVVNPTTVNQFQTGSLGSHQLGFIGDFNGDGLLDGMTLNPNNLRFNFFRNLGNGTLANPVSAGTLSSDFTWGNFMSGDFNGDGRDEVIGQILSGPIGVGSMRSQNFDGTSQFYIRLATGYGAMVAGDFNGDGIDDIVGLFDNPGQTRANIIPIISINTPVGRRMTAILGSGQFGQSVATGGLHNLVSADFNGDGRDDIAVINSNGQVLTASTVGTPRINAPDARTFITANSSPKLATTSFSDIVQVGNFDNDILADLFTFHDLGHQVSTTSTLTVDRLPVQTLGIEANPVAGNDAIIGDFDGDGLDDTVVLGTNMFLFTSNGTTFDEPAQDFGPVIGGPIGQFGTSRTGRVM
ncbi:MAG: VCBS repeat-containing protein [Planctomycetaceae bacterium]